MIPSKHDRHEKPRPGRAEIETLCILHALAAGACTAVELDARLGLRSGRSRHVDEAVGPLVTAGWVAREHDALRCTEAGREHLRARLLRYGLAGPDVV